MAENVHASIHETEPGTSQKAMSPFFIAFKLFKKKSLRPYGLLRTRWWLLAR